MSGISERRLWVRQQQMAKNNANRIYTEEVKDGDILIWNKNRWINANIKSILPTTVDTTHMESLDKKINTYNIDSISAIDNMKIGDRIYVVFTDNDGKIFTWTGKTWQINGETIEIKCCEDLKRGDTVKLSVSSYGVEKTNSNNNNIIGITVFDSNIDNFCTVAIGGIWFINSNDIEYSIGTKLTLDSNGNLSEINYDNYYVTILNICKNNIIPVLINNKNTVIRKIKK